jgi:colicin import membrane protein
VHAAFFALIIFGVSWQVKAPEPIAAELWSALPNVPVPVVEPPPPDPSPTPTPTPVKPPEPPVESKPAPTKADIALKAKKERDEKLKQERAAEAAKKKAADDKRKADGEKQREAEEAKRKAAEEKVRAEAEAREAAVRTAREAAVRDYMSRIAALINSRTNVPDSVIGKPEIQVRVRLLTNGSVFEASISRSSGNRAYDDAVERAIAGIRQWPVPENPEILGRQRELLLNIRHER